MKITEYEGLTGETVERPATKAEAAALAKLATAEEAMQIQKAEIAAAKAALLERLQITEEEARLLLA